MAAQDSGFPIVGIGASAGGIEALRELFSALPAESGMAFVVIQHLDPAHESHMPAVLAKYTGMKVTQAGDRMPVEANAVYTIPPNKFLGIKEGMLYLTETVKRDGLRMPIDFFFRSLAEDQRERAICVLLSGSGTDGTLGLREIRAFGGLTVVQDPETAQYDFMLRSAIATGQVDYVLPTERMAEVILKYAEQNYIRGAERNEARNETQDIDSILNLVAAQANTDFTPYKKSTIVRRIERRMGIRHVSGVFDYLKLLRSEPAEVTQLARDLLINVSSFFRDAEAFEELREKALKPLVQEKKSGSPLRAWVSGCATGEEAYSILILLFEEMKASQKNLSLQLFASDIDGDALKSAREGIYPQSIAADLSEERLKRFFTKTDDSYQVSKQLRESVIFSPQNMITEPPFSNLDLVSCRNALIYFEPDVQRRVISLFSIALRRGGYLFLGKSEGLSDQSELFEAVSPKWRIFRQQSAAQPGAFHFPLSGERRGSLPEVRAARPPHVNLQELNQQALLAHFGAAIVLTDEKGNIRHFYGPTRDYLEHPTGEASLNLLELVAVRVSARLRPALRKAAREGERTALERVPLSRRASQVNITVRPVEIRGSGERLAAVIFEKARGPAKPGRPRRGKKIRAEESLVGQLEAELKALKEDFKAATDEYETSSEELKAANEEVLSINEELQSTNEELETSKEEIQAINEELTTVNNQLNLKIEEVTEANSDLANFLNSSEVATLFLNKELRIRRFTPAAQATLNLISSDVGRPLSHLSHNFIELDLQADARKVLETAVPIEREVKTSGGRWQIMRCLLYRDVNDEVGGVVFTFNDVTRLKLAEEALEEARDYAQAIVATVREPLLVLGGDLRVVSANPSFYTTFQVKAEETEGRLIYDLGSRQWDIPGLRTLLGEILFKSNALTDFEVEHDFPAMGRRTMLLNARKIAGAMGRAELILLAIEDITERQRLERELRQAQKLEAIGTLAAGIAHDFNNILTVILGYAAHLREGGTRAEEVSEGLDALKKAGERGQEMVRQLLTFARKSEVSFKPVQINYVIRDFMQMFDPTLKKLVAVSLDLKEGLPAIVADRAQLGQCLLNLCFNSRDAMPDGGTLFIKTALVERRDLRDRFPAVTAEGYVCVTVSDTGVGMDERLKKRIFEPFFTTKEEARSGLGLAIVYAIVGYHNGFIDVESQPGKGTSFRLFFPVGWRIPNRSV